MSGLNHHPAKVAGFIDTSSVGSNPTASAYNILKMSWKLASHDTMTYLKPTQWYLYPFQFMAKCQSKTIEEQYDKYGIRYFDLRVKFDEGNMVFAHGLITYKGNVWKVLEYLNSQEEEVWVRLLLEATKEDEIQDKFFIAFCQNVEEKYKNIKFHNGRRKYDWKQIYKFKFDEPSLDQKVSSMTWKIWDDWFPYLYARLMNKKNIAKGTDKDFLALDFVHIQ